MELFDNAKVETSADTRERAIRALGLDEVPVEKKLNRSDFPSDESYFDAVARLSVQHNDPAYREAYRAIRRQYNAEKEAAEADAAEQQHQAEIDQAIRDCVLSTSEQARVDDEARSRARADLAAGRISFQQLGAVVADYAEKLTAEAKELKVHNADINKQIRAAMSQVIRQR